MITKSTDADWFVGRDAELQRLEAQLAEAVSGVPRMVVVSGPPGIGKTALVRRFSIRSTGRTLWVGGAGAETRHGLVDVGIEVLRALTSIEADRLILVVDDAHRADGPSVAALGFALSRAALHLGASALLDGPESLDHGVAAELVVGIKTVEHHLNRIYAKLGLRSRSELAARFSGRAD